MLANGAPLPCLPPPVLGAKTTATLAFPAVLHSQSLTQPGGQREALQSVCIWYLGAGKATCPSPLPCSCKPLCRAMLCRYSRSSCSRCSRSRWSICPAWGVGRAGRVPGRDWAVVLRRPRAVGDRQGHALAGRSWMELILPSPAQAPPGPHTSTGPLAQHGTARHSSRHRDAATSAWIPPHGESCIPQKLQGIKNPTESPSWDPARTAQLPEMLGPENGTWAFIPFKGQLFPQHRPLHTGQRGQS